MRRPFLTSLVLASVLAVGSPAFADPLTAQDEATARFQTGLKYYDARDFESARLAFTQAYAVLQKPGILLNLALSELYTNRPIEALQHFEQYLGDSSAPADKRERAKKAMDEAFKKTGHLVVKTAPEAQLSVDGKALPANPAIIHVMPGAHPIEARLGGKTKTATVDARAGETTNVDLAFDRESTPAVAPIAPTSTPDPRLTEPPREAARTESFWGLRSISGLALVGVGAVGLGIGFAAKGEQSTQADKVARLGGAIPPGACASAPTAECSELADAISSRNDASARAGTYFVLGGVSALVGGALVVSALVWPHRRETSAARSTPRILPVTGPRQAGLLFTSEF
jgi:hypothetical protein